MADIIFTIIICITIVMLPQFFAAKKTGRYDVRPFSSRKKKTPGRNWLKGEHATQLSMVLTTASLSEAGESEAEILRPGDRLCLEGSGNPSLCRVRVLSRGREIGEILPGCVSKVWNAMRRHRVCGAYIADICKSPTPSASEMRIALLCHGADTDPSQSSGDIQHTLCSPDKISVKMCNQFTLFLN